MVEPAVKGPDMEPEDYDRRCVIDQNHECDCEVQDPERECHRIRQRSEQFQAHLEWASAEVAKWPEWKRNILGRPRT